MGGYDTTSMWGWGIGMMVLTPLLWAAVIGLAIWIVVRPTRPERGGGPPEPTAQRILEDRLARGEIDLEEFRARSAALARTNA